MIFRTDIAKEAIANNGEFETRDFVSFGIKGTEIVLKDQKTADLIGKKKGRYVSFESNAVLNRNVIEYSNISRAIAKELCVFLKNTGKEDTVLVAGLGNKSMTPDSIGPRVVDSILVTRHIFEFMPETLDKRMSPVCAIAPNVLGVTGIESADIIHGICEKAHVKAIIVIDALAARKKERMFSTFQITDTGISPGAGVGNKRSPLTEEKLGIPVIAIGVPTVVYATSLVYDTAVEMLSNATGRNEDEISDAAMKIAQRKMGDMVVTPKEIDIIATDSGKIIADGINLALQRGMTLSEINSYMT